MPYVLLAFFIGFIVAFSIWFIAACVDVHSMSLDEALALAGV